MLDIKIERTKAPKAKPVDETKLGFGKIFTDHMFLMDYTAGEGWHDPRIVPYAPFQMDPACVVFHYAQELFEGLKAYRTAAGDIQLFRPDCNAQRCQDSSDRMCVPKIPVEDFVQAVEALVNVDTRLGAPHRRRLPLHPSLRHCHRRGSGRARLQALHLLHHLLSLRRLLCRGSWLPCASMLKISTSVPRPA